MIRTLSKVISLVLCTMSFMSAADDKNEHELPVEQCNQNSAEACEHIGMYYTNVVGDDSKALPFFQKGCELKDGIACNLLGSFYENGENVNKDLKKAINYYTRACNEGDWAQACETLKEISDR